MNQWKSVSLSLVALGVGVPSWAAEPSRPPSSGVAHGVASDKEGDYPLFHFAVPKDRPTGDISVESAGITEIEPENGGKRGPALHVRMTIDNNADETPWTFDTREVVLTFAGGEILKPTFVNTDAGPPPELRIERGQRRTVDLFFAVPEASANAETLSAFEVAFTARPPGGAITERASFPALRRSSAGEGVRQPPGVEAAPQAPTAPPAEPAPRADTYGDPRYAPPAYPRGYDDPAYQQPYAYGDSYADPGYGGYGYGYGVNGYGYGYAPGYDDYYGYYGDVPSGYYPQPYYGAAYGLGYWPYSASIYGYGYRVFAPRWSYGWYGGYGGHGYRSVRAFPSFGRGFYRGGRLGTAGRWGGAHHYGWGSGHRHGFGYGAGIVGRGSGRAGFRAPGSGFIHRGGGGVPSMRGSYGGGHRSYGGGHRGGSVTHRGSGGRSHFGGRHGGGGGGGRRR